MRAIPTIRTARLTLRAMRPQDFDRYADICGAPSAEESLLGEPLGRADAWNAFLRNAGHWHMTGFGQWAIEPHGSGVMMGQVGFFARRPWPGAAEHPWREARWRLHPEASGTNLGADAAHAAHDWFDRVVTGPLYCRCSAGNRQAEELALALGYSVAEPDDGHDDPRMRVFVRKGPPGGPRNLLEEVNLW